MDAMAEQVPPPRQCPSDGVSQDIAAAGTSATVLVGVLCCAFVAAFLLERLVRSMVSVQASTTPPKAGGVPVQERLGVVSRARRAPPPHPSEERLSASNAKVAAEVVSALERRAAEESSESDDEGPVDIDELRQQVAQRVSPGMRPATSPCSSHKRVTGGLRGFTCSKPLHFEAVFDRTTLHDPTDFWLAKFALTNREEFEQLVAETQTEPPTFVQDSEAPLERLRSDVYKLKSSLAQMSRQHRMPGTESPQVVPTPVKQPALEKLSDATASPPVSPVLNLEDGLDEARKFPLVDSAEPPAASQPTC